jgi:crotonobetainyl-CoA:carnitine CoA-transferase CaiB-like acyl-CoA transferase
VVVENFRPGVSDKLQFGYERRSIINPRLVYGSISSYGSRGPIQAQASGLLAHWVSLHTRGYTAE